MQTLADRISWVIASGRVATSSVWCEKAGLARTYLATFLSRTRQGTPSDMGLQVAIALAKSADVSFAWFALGEGTPEDASGRLPGNLERLLRRVPEGTYPKALVAQALLVRDLIGEADLPEDVWQDYLDGLRKEARRLGLELAASRLDSRGIKR